MRRAAILLAAVTLLSSAAWAQFEMGSIVGLVVDPSSGPISGASVDIRNTETNVTRHVTATTTGRYDSMPLQPGTYTVVVKAASFRGQAQQVTLSVGQRMELNFTLEIGTVNEQVTVSATATTVETGSSELGNIRPEKEIIDLPVNTRNFTQLVVLTPGVNNHGGSASNNVLQGYTSGRGTNGAVINGAPSEYIVYLYDGINSMDTDASDVMFFPNMDSISEFKVQTSVAPSAYGGGPGIVNVTFKSGTNDLHGTAWEFVRNSDFDAKNFFDSHTLPIPPFKLNQFGLNMGGPVVLPKIVNGKNKLFFFADYEGRRVRQAQTYTSTVPVAAFKTGDFSALLPRTVVKDPTTLVPLPNDIFPASMINKTSANLIALYPAQNLPGLVNNYLYNPMQDTRMDQGDVRVDYRTNTSVLFGRYSYYNPDTFAPGYLPGPAVGGGPSRPGDTIVPAEQGIISYGRTFGATKYYEGRIAFTRMFEDIVDQDSGNMTLAQDLGIPNANAGGAGGLTNISVAGTVGLGDGSGSLWKFNNNWEFDQAFSWVKGRHSLKFGVDILTRRFAFWSPSYPVGQFTFSGIYTGYGLADFEYGHPISSEMSASQFFSMKRYQPALYAQDDIRLTSKLTLNIGLRDDILTAWHERHNRLEGFVPTSGGNFILVGNPPFQNGAVTQSNWLDLGPRFGFAYNVASKTVIRGGYGIYYTFQSNTSNDNQAKNPPYNGNVIVTNSANDYADAAPISAGFSPDRPALYPITNQQYIYWPYNYEDPSIQEWNLNLQRQLPSNVVLSVAYVGTKGSHIDVFDNCNAALPGPGAVGPRRPFPNLSDCVTVTPWANSSYNSLQASVERRMAGGLTMLASYSWAHSIDNNSGQESETVQTPYNLHLNRGNSTFDVRQSLVLSWTYDMPFGKNLKGPGALLVKGWTLNSIDSFINGSPFTPTMQTNTLNAGSGVQWPNRIASGRISNPSVDMWFNPAAFVAPGAYIYGNDGRNVLTGPGTAQVDLSLFKNFSLGRESRRLQLRAEVFNILNTPQFNNPNASIGNAGAGIITSAGSPPIFQRTSREIQVAAKLYW